MGWNVNPQSQVSHLWNGKSGTNDPISICYGCITNHPKLSGWRQQPLIPFSQPSWVGWSQLGSLMLGCQWTDLLWLVYLDSIPEKTLLHWSFIELLRWFGATSSTHLPLETIYWVWRFSTLPRHLTQITWGWSEPAWRLAACGPASLIMEIVLPQPPRPRGF